MIRPAESQTPARLRLAAPLLRLFPASFRARYADQILLTLSDAARDAPKGSASPSGLSTGTLLFHFQDLVRAAARERIAMLVPTTPRRRIGLATVALAVVMTAFGLVAALTLQQVLRRSTDQPQRQMADRAAQTLAANPASAQPPTLPGLTASGTPNAGAPAPLDIASTLQPFTILYSAAGDPLQSDARLDGSIPAPPAGVFQTARRKGSNVLTWQPRPGIRLAAVVLPVANGGYVLVARSLAITESGEHLLRQLAFGGWLLLLAGLALAGAFLARPQPQARLAS